MLLKFAQFIQQCVCLPLEVVDRLRKNIKAKEREKVKKKPNIPPPLSEMIKPHYKPYENMNLHYTKEK